MVDALKKISTLLAPSGRLISIQPQDDNLPIFVRVGQTIAPVGVVDVSYNFPRYSLANQAVQAVIDDGLYAMEQDHIVDYTVRFDTITACRQYLNEEWSNAILADDAWEQITNLMAENTQSKEIYYIEQVRFCALVLA